MLDRSSIGAIILAAALLAGCDAALAFDKAKYPD
jgi:outer membrane murein-binding lipoprotein Lpp